MPKVELTDELRQSLEPLEPIAWYVPLRHSAFDGKICDERHEAENEALMDLERGDGEKSVATIYPLFAGHGVDVTD